MALRECFKETIEQLYKLLQCEMTLARIEAKNAVQMFGSNLWFIGKLAIAFFLGTLSLLLSAILFLAELFGGKYRYGLSAMVLGVFISSIAGLVLMRRMKKFSILKNYMPETQHTVKENITIINETAIAISKMRPTLKSVRKS